MSTVPVSVRLADRAVERLDNLAKSSGNRRGVVVSHALLVFAVILADPTQADPMVQYLRKEYKINGA